MSPGRGEGNDGSRLGHAKPFEDIEPQGAQTTAYLHVEGRSPAHQIVDVSAHLLPHTAEDEA